MIVDKAGIVRYIEICQDGLRDPDRLIAVLGAMRLPASREWAGQSMMPDVDGIIAGCPRCGGPLNVKEHDLKPELCTLYVRSGPGAKAYRRPLIAYCENEVIITCPACSFWASFPMC